MQWVQIVYKQPNCGSEPQILPKLVKEGKKLIPVYIRLTPKHTFLVYPQCEVIFLIKWASMCNNSCEKKPQQIT